MEVNSKEELLLRIEELENRLAESEQLIEAIKAGEVDAFAVNSYNNDNAEVYTLQSGDYAYRVLIEKFGEGALNLTEDGLIVYTNTYFFELINLYYENVVGSFFADFVHADSKEKFNALLQQALMGNSKGEINLFVNDKIIPVYISLTSLQPKLATVGIIITDLTEKKKNEELILKYQEDLEAKNLELIQSNTEIASFTYIASHDLQEPLRKIQTFSNMIVEREYESFSQNAKIYFQRISAASQRMQNLIIALLNYSRTNTTEISLTSTSLNTIIEEVKNNLKELLEENNVTIEISALPTVNIVPLLFQQLFSNIIMNSIKYRKPDVDPLIKISADIVTADKMQLQAAIPGYRYWKIKISDNGIGFEQQYADKIFDLFQRLHSRSEYGGTGIGLAICKKIVQSHHGFIEAVGKPGIGSTFNIYLPVDMAV
ncbi:MAG TPA: ATP-binding protein [Parafilimonas sp.]